MVVDTLVCEAKSVQFDSLKLKQGERQFYGSASVGDAAADCDGRRDHHNEVNPTPSKLVQEIAHTRKLIEQSLNEPVAHVAKSHGSGDAALIRRVETLETQNSEMKTEVIELRHMIMQLEKQISSMSGTLGKQSAPSAPAKPAAEAAEDDEEDVDLFGSDDEEEDEEAEKLKAQRLEAYAQKKSTKPGVIAKSNIILDVKPWDDETDMVAVEKAVREIQMDGLIWGVSKLVPLAYGIKKLQICCVVEDDKVSIDELSEKIEANEDLVQSVDIAAFNKI